MSQQHPKVVSLSTTKNVQTAAGTRLHVPTNLEYEAALTQTQIGSAKAAVGGFVGADGLKREGNEQNRQGQAQEAHGQLSDLGSGVSDRIQGAVGSGIAGLTGDKAGQEHYDAMHADGKAAQRGAEKDIQKQNQ